MVRAGCHGDVERNQLLSGPAGTYADEGLDAIEAGSASYARPPASR